MKRRNVFKVDYWQSMADVLSVILLIFIMLLMLLSLVWVSSEEEKNYNLGGDGADMASMMPIPFLDLGEGRGDTSAGGGGQNTPSGQGEGTGKKGDYEQEVLDVPQIEEESLAAVKVRVVDEETNKAIKMKGISFQLYTSQNALKTLYSYYPQKMTYQSFETTEQGEFYLPEKLTLGDYYLKNVVASKGYGIGEEVRFKLERSYDWNEAYTVTFLLKPVTKCIRIHVTDSETGEGVSGGSFIVSAKKDIVTKDGTVRVKQGEVVDTIKCNEEGFAQSKELFLGAYEIQQKETAQYYSSIEDISDVTMDNNDSTHEPQMVELVAEKTKAIIAVQDELRETEPALGAAFNLSKKNGEAVQKYEVEQDGTFAVTDLRKDQYYQLTQVEWGENYMHKQYTYNFYVDKNGRIEGKTVKNLTISNRMIRVRITTRGMLLKDNLAGYSMILKDEHGNTVQKFRTKPEPIELEGLEPGEYVLYTESLNSLEFGQKEVKVVVKDEKNIQTFDYSIWTVTSTIICAFILVSLLGILILVILKRRKKEK